MAVFLLPSIDFFFALGCFTGLVAADRRSAFNWDRVAGLSAVNEFGDGVMLSDFGRFSIVNGKSGYIPCGYIPSDNFLAFWLFFVV